jgi:transketolase
MKTTRDQNELRRMARVVRTHIVKMVGIGKKGHIGGGCSATDLVVALYFGKMRHDPQNPQWPDRDRFLFSKGHSCLPQYACLAEAGYFPRAELARIKTLGARLQGHPELHRVPGVEATTGSLGQGISIACGMAAGLRLDGHPSRVYCILGDGELAEGQVWEAALSASVYKLDNLVAILDNNGLMTNGPIAQRYNTMPHVEKWRAFGWHVVEIDGHDMGAILEALDAVDEVHGKPKIIVAHTIKAKGISFAENRAEYHNGTLTAEQYAQALRELDPEALPVAFNS